MAELTRHLAKSVNLELLSEDLMAALPILQSITVNGFERPGKLPDGSRGIEYTMAAGPKVTSSKSERQAGTDMVVKTDHISQPGEIIFTFERDLVGAETGAFSQILANHVASARTPGQVALAQRVVDVADLRARYPVEYGHHGR